MSFAPATLAGLETAIGGAATVALSAYVLDARSSLVAALDAAGDRGAHVHVVLDGAPIGAGKGHDDGILRCNEAAVAELREHGVDAVLSDGVTYAQHLKAAVVDGRAFMDDRNWTASDTLVTTSDAAGVAAVAGAIAGHPGATAELATTKPAAIALEAAAISSASGDRIDCASESFGPSVVSAALARRAAAGAHVRLVVSARALHGASNNEKRALARLAAAGVELRAGASTDKLCVAVDRAWFGSANATWSPPPPMLDWGLTTADAALRTAASDAFARDWAQAKPVTADALRLS